MKDAAWVTTGRRAGGGDARGRSSRRAARRASGRDRGAPCVKGTSRSSVVDDERGRRLSAARRRQRDLGPGNAEPALAARPHGGHRPKRRRRDARRTGPDQSPGSAGGATRRRGPPRSPWCFMANAAAGRAQRVRDDAVRRSEDAARPPPARARSARSTRADRRAAVPGPVEGHDPEALLHERLHERAELAADARPAVHQVYRRALAPRPGRDARARGVDVDAGAPWPATASTRGGVRVRGGVKNTRSARRRRALAPCVPGERRWCAPRVPCSLVAPCPRRDRTIVLFNGDDRCREW